MSRATRTPMAIVLGAATAAYGAAVLARPEVMTSPLGLGQDRTTRALTRAVGLRDLASGVALALAPAGWPRRAALVARITADLGDAAVLGTSLSDPKARAKAVAGAGGWGLVNGLALLAELRDA